MSFLAGILNSLWCALALALAAWTLGRCLRANAATRHLLWWTVLALTILLPIGRLDRRQAQPALAMVRSHAPAIVQRAIFIPAAPRLARSVFPLRLPPGGWPRAVVALWALFALAQFGRIIWSLGYLLAVKRGSQPAPAALRQSFACWVDACDVKRPVRLLISARIASPMAVGFFDPAVILPAALLDQFRPSELDHVLLHELAHVARRDDWSNLAARCLAAAIGLHPVAAWVLRRIAHERELACDDWVVSRTGEAQPYAASLARLFELCRAHRQMLLASGMSWRLGERIEILLGRGRQFSTRASLARVAFAAMALFALAVAMSARAPRWIVLAQSAPAHAAPAAPAAPVAPRPVNPHGGFLAALVAAGYGDLSVDEIIALKDHGITADYLAGISESGWERLTAGELIELRAHGVPPALLGALRDAGYTKVGVGEVIDAFSRGLTPVTLREAAQYSTHLTLAQVVRLKQAGVIR